MSKTYNKSIIEIKAKELLFPLQVACPDTLWQELSYQLNEYNSKSENKWTNKLYTPKALALAMVGIAIIIVAGWKLSSGMGGRLLQKSAPTPAEKPQAALAPSNNNFLADKPAKPVADTSHITKIPAKDSVKNPAVAIPAANTVIAPIQQQPAITKVDTAALRRYYIRIAYRRRRDSLAMVAQNNKVKTDSVTRAGRHAAHDSVARIKADTTGK
jgi:hypothetical protein